VKWQLLFDVARLDVARLELASFEAACFDLICFHLATVLLPASPQRMHPSRPLRPQPQMTERPVLSEILHARHGFGGGARPAAEPALPMKIQPAQRKTRPRRQALAATPIRALALAPLSEGGVCWLPVPRWLQERRRVHHRKTWAAAARVPSFHPSRESLPAFCGASGARSSICAYSACSTLAWGAAICRWWQAGYRG
jgi:hypothetical protein